MDSVKWKKIKDILSATLDLPENERADFLANQTDKEIRSEVEKLLSARQQFENFMVQPIMVENGFIEDSKEDNLIGQQVDDYRILQRIGTGGMGAVYLAERLNSDFKQKVALKLIKRGMDSDAILRRFATERRILSTLKHPNIAGMLDGGISNDGLSFFVMEFVDGKPLNEYCRENNLTLKKRLEIFLLICSAVEHAHKNLVIHRDLKPSNILVTNDGIPKLLDFGIAKLLSNDEEAATLTATQGRVFTPEYASPEQILGKAVTTATDVYSLGVILYEILSGQRPFDTRGKSFEEIVKSVCDTEPMAPSDAGTQGRGDLRTFSQNSEISTEKSTNTPSHTLRVTSSQLKGDLDNIILKALRKEPSERYGSVQQFSEDILRFLKGLPVLARPNTIQYRFGKYIKRHKAGVAAAALVLFSLVGGISVATWQAVEARQERAKAEQRFNEVRQLANSLMFEVHDSIQNLSGSTPARKLLVQKALGYLDKLASESKNDMTLLSELAKGYEKVGDVQGSPMSSNLGDTEGAIESYRKALQIRELLAAVPNNFAEKYDLAMLHSKFFRLMMLQNNFAEAENHSRQAINILDELVNIQPDNLLHRLTQARFHLELAELLSSKKDANPIEASQNYQQSIEICDSIPPSAEMNIKAEDGLSLNEKLLSVKQLAYRRIGYIAESQNKFNEALEIYQKALSASQTLAETNNPPTPPAQIVLAISLGNVGRMQANTGKIEEAISNTSQSLEICEKLVKEDSKNYLAVSELASAFENIGFVYLKKGDFQSSIVNFKKSLELREKLREKAPDDIYNISNLGETLAYIGNNYEELKTKSALLEAKKWHQRSLDIWLDLERQNKLPAYYSGKIQEQKEAVSRCQMSLK